MPARVKNLVILFSIIVVPEVCLAQVSQGMKSKLFDLLYIFVPMAIIVTTFVFLEWRRRRSLKPDKLVDLPINKSKK